MNARIGRLWPLRGAENDAAHPSAEAVEPPGAEDLEPSGEPVEAVVLLEPEDEIFEGPEQPVLLAPTGVSRQVHVGDVLPPARRGWTGRLARRLPTVPKRAILTAGVCVGLAAPAITRHLALKLLGGGRGGATGGAQATLEITRVVFHGPLTAEAIATIHKALTAGRR
jgi:hypothetical protein